MQFANEDFEVFVYDFEVFVKDWLVVFKSEAGDYHLTWNDGEALKGFLEHHSDALFVGFNSSHYDQYIAKAIVAGADPETVKELNDFIIEGRGMPWEHPALKGVWFSFNDVDLMKDTQMGFSLKSYEAHSGMDIEESAVDFNIDRALTDEEKAEVEHYCKHDVDATEALLHARMDYLTTKVNVGLRANLSVPESLSKTNAKLSACVLGAESVPGVEKDERNYVYPDNLILHYIPDEVKAFFDRTYDQSVSDEELYSSKLELMIGRCPVTLGFGGIHGAIPKFSATNEDCIIINADVSSYYPSLMIFNRYTSRAMDDSSVYENIYYERLEAKEKGDKDKANSLKLIVNSTYGATLNQYNDLYDPKNARSVCISGQLYLLELAYHIVKEIPSAEIIQLNTDGIMVKVLTEQDRQKVKFEICENWSWRTNFELEFDEIERISQKDVNNYAMRLTNGKEKIKGGYLVRGESKAGVYSINNNARIVADAIKAFLLDDIPVEKTILECDDPAKFQLIAKASSKYSEVFQEIFPEPVGKAGEEHVARNKCNRVFATTDKRYGKLYKVKKDNGQIAKIESLPEHCLVYNKGFPDIRYIDKQWYVSLAQKRVSDFFTTEENMATRQTKTQAKPETQPEIQPEAQKVDYSTWNVYKKLSKARAMFLESDVKKTGVNRHMEFEYFQLEDIVPNQTRIFDEIGLLEYTTYVPGGHKEIVDSNYASGGEIKTTFHEDPLIYSRVINVDNPSEMLEFRLKWGEMPPQKNKNGDIISNPAQDEGKVETYLRRYIKMLILDLVEVDSLDAELGQEEKKPTKTPSKATKSPTKPASEATRKQVAKEITNAEGSATKLQITQLRKQMKKMKETYGEQHPEVSTLIAEIGVETNNLAEVTKTRCEEIIRQLGEMRESFEKGE